MKNKGWAVMGCLLASPGFAAEALPKDATPAPVAVFNFDRDALGRPPQRFTPAVTGEGPEFRWEVRQDAEAPSKPNVLVQSGKAKPGDNFALLLLDNILLEHGEIAVRIKTLAGDENQDAGIVYRYQDPSNYYVIRVSAQDDSCALFRMKKGKLKQLDLKDVILSPYTWHELRIIFVHENYTALIDGQTVMGGKDSSFKGKGLAGLWTKADSVIAFDDFRVSQ